MSRYFRKQKIFNRFLISYLFVLILPIIIIGVVNLIYNTKLLMEQTQREGYNNLDQIRQVLDREFSEFQEIAYALGKNSNIRKIMFEQNKIEIIDAKRRALSDLQVLNATSGFSDEIVVYLNRFGEFLNNSSYYDAKLMIEKYKLDNFTPEEFAEYFTASGRPIQYLSAENGKKHYLVYFKNIPVDNGPFQGYVLMFVDDSKIRKQFNSRGYSNRLNFILDDTNKIVFSDNSRTDLLNSVTLPESDGFFNKNIDGRDYLISSVRSTVYPLRYISFVAKNDITASITSMINTLIITLLFCLIFGIVESFLFSQRNARPIRSLLDTILDIGQNEGATIVDDHRTDEYRTVINILKNSFSKSRLLMEKVSHQLPSMQMHFISNLLAGKIKNENECNEMLEFLNMRFCSAKFCVVVTNIDDYHLFAPEKNETNTSLVKFAITNVFTEMMEDISDVYNQDAENGEIFLLCFRPEKINSFDLSPDRKDAAPLDSLQNNAPVSPWDTENSSGINSTGNATINSSINSNGNSEPAGSFPIFTEFENRIFEFQNSVWEKLHIQISIGVGSVHEGAINISKSYSEASLALNQRFILGNQTLMMYHRISPNNASNYYYPIEKEIQLLNLVKSGEFEGSKNIIDEIYYENTVVRKLPINMAHCLAFNIVGTVLNVLDEINLSIDVSSLIQKLFQIKTIEQLHKVVIETLSVVCGYINESRESRNARMKNEIIDYIMHNYHDCNLSLLSVADHFNVSSSYLSRYFKDQTGVNFADYLCRIRILRAKELLKNQNLSVSDIALMVGYNCPNSFIRTFKRYESITPGQFREQLAN